MKIPFDIKYKSQIESGEYKVINRIGEKVRIVYWDGPDEDYPIVAFDGEARTPYTWGKDGRFMTWRESDRDLFILTPEPDLTEFEKGIKRGFLCAGLEDVPTGIIKDTAKELLELAKEELCKGCTRGIGEYWRGRKEAMEEASKGFHYEGPAIQTYFPPCYHGGPCTNPMHDCINCPRQSTSGINTTTGTSSAKLEG